MASGGGRGVSRAALVALGLTLAQTAWVTTWSPGSTLGEKYLRMAQWDALHYLEIAENGYHMPAGEPTSADVHEMRANVAFFPALPLAARGFARVSGLPVRVALLAVSQAFAFAFWFLLIRILDAGGVSARERRWILAAVAAQPAAFFLVTGYSESMFLAGILGMIHWSGTCAPYAPSARGRPASARGRPASARGRPASARWRPAWARSGRALPTLAAGASGAVMTAARIVGAPLVAAPLLQQWRDPRRWPGAIALGALGAAGVAAFFGWCQARYGRWDLYVRLQQLGWGNRPDYLAIFNPLSYLPRFFFEDTVTSFSRLSVGLTAALFVAALRADGFRRALGERAGLYYTAFVAFYLPLSGKAQYSMDSMSRYSFPPVVLLFIALALARASAPRPGQGGQWPAWLTVSSRRARWAWAAILLLGLAVQGWMALLYCRGRWVA